jgi:ADP-L-glycero-D-manno-heptose 6-epimerase
MVSGKPVLFEDTVHATRDWLYVADAVQALVLAAVRGRPGVYNIGSGVAHSFRQLIVFFNQLMGKQLIPTLIPNPNPTGYQYHTCTNIEKARSELGYNPSPIVPGMKHMIRQLIEKN